MTNGSTFWTVRHGKVLRGMVYDNIRIIWEDGMTTSLDDPRYPSREEAIAAHVEKAATWLSAAYTKKENALRDHDAEITAACAALEKAKALV